MFPVKLPENPFFSTENERYLTKEEEYKFIELLKKAEVAKRKLTYTNNSIQLETDLLNTIKEGSYAWKELVMRNRGYVIKCALKRRYRHEKDFMDLIQVGNLAIRHSALKFNTKLNIRFLTYAGYWIEQFMDRYLEKNSRSIRIPSNLLVIINSLEEIENQYLLENGELPDIDEIIKKMPKYLNANKDSIDRARRWKKDAISLDIPKYDKEESGDILDFIEDSSDTQETGDYKIIKDYLTNLLHSLDMYDPRMKKIVAMYFGLSPYGKHTLDEIGRMYGVSRERVRQLKEEALVILREKIDGNQEIIDFFSESKYF